MAFGKWITGGPRHRLVAGVCAAALLAGCAEDGGQLFQSSGAAATTAGGSTRLVERDVEAPEVFQESEAGLWDGRPSLGGVWVAHPAVTEPERALIRNTANNKFVIGALFKPSVERSGPRFQVSSDAAEALGMLAGQPVNLNVTALRREEVPTAPSAAPAPEQADTAEAADPGETMPAPEAVETATLDPVAGAAAALDRAEDAGQAAETVGETAVDAAAPEAPRKKRRWFWQKKEPEVATTAAPPAPAAAPAAPEAAAAPAAATPAPAPRPVSRLDKPYLQIGIFSVERNARNTAVAMRQAGMIPTVLEQSSQGKTFWRVIVGPATTSDERAALLDKIKAAGFTDAYAVTN
ncbi:lipoprotein, putative [Pseudooceanicola batsensis HTCC2597]|uniref:Lipoprotein, putative n=1 Tax=Pseudooceanicola batsensis (strain ATCC BAA-863 / DSM 15984 / KCTC 12145 / HTCC2597) TaxID=252305 RepID=A3TUH1_PSEBH|nr:SPOR domain-containing protein [Pseudooceanicola batsensis]EAQ04167.1 lipoprotein, putative [Pseudooceanicola batsensis HTCC2597]